LLRTASSRLPDLFEDLLTADEPSAKLTDSFVKIVAIFTVYNEERLIRRTIRHLVEQGVESYVIDNESTDNTQRIVESMTGKGVIGVEVLPRHGVFELTGHLKRKEELHCELGADWYIHHDADEIREAPSPWRTLTEGIRAVEAAGYNTIDFHEFLFMPTSPEEDYYDEQFVERMRYYCFLKRPTGAGSRINAWKNLGQAIDLASSGGHQVKFADRRVYPQKFILRHYIALSYEHVLRKYCERKYSREELQKEWHWTRATLRPRDICFPDRSLLKEVSPDNTWDTSDPWEEEPLFRNARRPLVGKSGKSD
jgi:glycosyltransferase involved in cell wall biosynthesis